MSGPTERTSALLCPSAPPEWDGGVVFGVVLGTPDAPRVAPLAEPLPVTADVLALCEPATPTEVLRIAAPCANERCANFKHGSCGLIDEIAAQFAPVVGALPHCRIRPQCRWWHQRGRDACLRCPQIVTDTRVAEQRAAAPPD